MVERENGRSAVGLPEEAGRSQGPASRHGLTAGTLRVLRGGSSGLYGVSFGVALLAGLVGAALVAAAFGLSWHYFALTWKWARSDIAYEDPPVGYFPPYRTGIFLRSLPFMMLLLPLAGFVLALLHSAGAVAVRDATVGGRRPGARELWRRCRPFTWLAVRVQLLTNAYAASLALPALLVWMFFENGGVPGVDLERLSHSTSAPYQLLGYGLPLVLLALALAVWFRLGPATAAVVDGATTARAAVRRSWSLTGGARRWRVFGVGLLLAALVVAAFWALSRAAAPLAHPVGLAVLWLTHDNPYAAGAVMEVVPVAAGLLLLTALVLPPVGVALALLHRELRAADGGSEAAAVSR
ncbi:hypothetical protein ACFV3R_03440 [Streptomyces sp. NPDC059740]|uniref:hypothetical protein n=1 Tax=Streptomyces sp. NPDC059740 TaxID=3346926 RepID=UPI0036575C28